MGAGVARQCSRNRCLSQWTVGIPHRGRRGGAVRANSKKDLVTGPIRVSVPFRVSVGRNLRYGLYEGPNFRVDRARPMLSRPGTFRGFARLYFRIACLRGSHPRAPSLRIG
jgi:hypothetical protein